MTVDMPFLDLLLQAVGILALLLVVAWLGVEWGRAQAVDELATWGEEYRHVRVIERPFDWERDA